jgi:hypothetical protein
LSASRVMRAGNKLSMKLWWWKTGSGSIEIVLGLFGVIRTIRAENIKSQWHKGGKTQGQECSSWES